MKVFFSYAFRPLFLLATVYAIAVVPYWVGAWLGFLPFPVMLGLPSWWHAHEMVFGFAGAAIGGFALTAVATWTSRPPVSGTPLLLLSAFWLIARILFLIPSHSLLAPAIIADLGYGLLLFALMSREVISVRNERNYKVLLILGLLVASDAAFFFGVTRGAGWTSTALYCGLWLIVILVNLIAGRIIPAFTRNWLKRQFKDQLRQPLKAPPMFGRFDLVSSVFLVGFAISSLLFSPSRFTAVIGLVTSVLLFIRLSRWQGVRGSAEPLVWVLHIAFLWIPVGILLLTFAELGLIPRTAGMHALTAGAITTMILAVASRAALGHTGRALKSHPLVTSAYVFITIAAMCRVGSAFGPASRILLALSAATWCVGLVCFGLRYAPVLTRPPLNRQGSLPTV